jgi:Flp pilus assembly protein TadD
MSLSEMNASKRQIVLLLVLATGLAYANSLNNSFLWDDDLLVVDNTYVRNWTYLDAAFVSDLFHDYTVGLASHYRPLQTVSYIFDYSIWGLNSFGYHLTNLLLHAACVLLVYFLVEQLCASSALSLFVAIGFAVHPVNTNAVTYISGRADPLCFAAMLASLLLFLEYSRADSATALTRVGLFTLSVVCYLVALFSRESAMLMPFLLFLYCAMFGAPQSHKLRYALQRTLPFAVLTVAFVLWRTAVLELQGKPLHPHWALPLTLRLQIPFRSLATYFGLLAWPSHLQMERQVVVGGPSLQLLTIFGIAIALGLIVLALWTRRNVPLACFGLCWFALTIAPLTGVLSLNATIAEHWLYVPSVGIYVCIAALYFHFDQRLSPAITRQVRALAASICLIAFPALTARTICRNRDWASAMSLYSSTKTAAPYSAGVCCNLGREYINSGDTDLALNELLAAERMEPRDPRAKSNLAAFFLTRGEFDKARAKAQECLASDPENTSALLQLAMIDGERKDFTAARDDYVRAIATTTDVRPRLQFGSFLVRIHRCSEALNVLDDVFALDPGNAVCFNLLGAILSEQHHFQHATRAFEMARSLDRHSPDPDLNLGRLAVLRGDLAAAVESYRRALRIQPDDFRAHYQLALVHWRLGKFVEAEQELQAASILAPASSAIRAAIQKVKQRARFESAVVEIGSSNS